MPDATINGFKHHYEDVGSGEPLVMIHGASSSSHTLAHNFDDLSKDFRVIAPDLRGLGGSAHVTEALPLDWVSDLVGLLDYLKIDKAHVYGVSLGARVALRFGIDHPDRTRSLILDAAVVLMEGGGDAALNANFDVSKMPQERKDNYRVIHGEDWEQVVINYFNFRNNPEFQEQLDLRKFLADVKLPTLVVRGDTPEPVHPLAHSMEIRETLPNARLAIVPNKVSGLNNSAPSEMRRFIREFVATLEAAAARY